MPWSSNATFLVNLGDTRRPRRSTSRSAASARCGTSSPACTAARSPPTCLSEAMGFGVVPPTVLRDDGPLGEGSLQWFVDADHREHYFTIAEQRPELHPQLRDIAVLDVVANNTDRKSGHCLLGRRPRLGDRQRPVLRPRLQAAHRDLGVRRRRPDRRRSSTAAAMVCRGVPAEVAALLDDDEVEAMQRRAAWLVEHGVLPGDESGGRYPWPLV